MRKSLVLLVTAIGGSASYGAGITGVGKEPGVSDPSTWRWHVSSIIDGQKRSDLGAAWPPSPAVFDQRYQRYSPLGVPEPRREPTP